MNLFFKKALAFFISLSFLAACSDRKDREEKETALVRKPVVSLNGQIFYENDFFNFASNVLKEMDPSSYDNGAVKDKLIKDFIEHNVLLMEARRRGVEVDNERIGAVLESFRTEKGAQDLKVYSGSYDTDHNKLADTLQERLIIEALINRAINGTVVISEKEIKDYYNKKGGPAKSELKAHLLQIFTARKETAEKALAELKKGLSFNEVAERYSESPEKKNGGDLGFVSDKDFPEIFSEAFKLPAGKISDIIKSEYGYHIFLVKKFEKSKKAPYDSVKSRIHFELYSKEQEKKTREFIDELYKNTNIVFLNDINLNNFAGGKRGGSSK